MRPDIARYSSDKLIKKGALIKGEEVTNETFKTYGKDKLRIYKANSTKYIFEF